MKLLNIIALILIAVYGIRCFFMAWYLHPETTENAGHRYNDESLKAGARDPVIKGSIKFRRNMYLLGGIISIACFIGLIVITLNY